MIRTLRKIAFLSVMTAALGYGRSASPGYDTSIAADTSIVPPENPLNPRVAFIYQGEKSTGAAFGWSALGTVAPVILGLSAVSLSDDATLPLILVLGGLTIGPSLGEFYAASPNRGLMGIGLRMSGAFLFLYMQAKAAPSYVSGEPLALIGLVPYLGSTIYSFYNANASVKRYNADLKARAEWGWSPILTPGTQGSMRTGALAYLRF
jgi:hypothetical protein